MKKLVSVLILVSLAVYGFSADIQSVIAQAETKSPSMQYINKNYDYQTLLIKTADLKDGLGLSVDFGGITLSDDITLFPSANFEVTLPEYVEDLTVKGSLNTSYTKETLLSDESYSFDPSVSVSKQFTFKDYEDKQDDLSKEKNKNSVESSYEKQICTFESGLIDAVISIMQAKVNIKTQETNLNDLQVSLSSKLSVGNIDKGSLAEIDANKNITKAKIQLESSIKSLETSLKDFENKFGIPYEDITSVPETDLTFEGDINKSVTVRNAAIELSIANQKLNEKLGNKTTVSLGASATGNLEFDGDFKSSSNSVTTDLSAGLSYKNLSLSAKYTGTIKKDTDYSPSVTISGRWNNDSKPQEVTESEILELQNNYLKAQNDYDDAVYSYNSQVQSLKSDIETLYSDIEQQKIDEQYNIEVLNYKKDLYARGLITESELSKAETSVETDSISNLVLQLKAMKLGIEIKSINL